MSVTLLKYVPVMKFHLYFWVHNIEVDDMLSKILVWLCCITDVIGMIMLCVRQYFTSNEKLFSTLIKLFSMKRFP